MKKFLVILLLTISVGCFAYKTLLNEEDWVYLEKDNDDDEYSELTKIIVKTTASEITKRRADGLV